VRVIFNGMLSRDLVRRLSDLWPGSIQVTAEYGENYADERLWAEAERLGLTIITKDRDYADAAFASASMLLKLSNSRRRTNATSRYDVKALMDAVQEADRVVIVAV